MDGIGKAWRWILINETSSIWWKIVNISLVFSSQTFFWRFGGTNDLIGTIVKKGPWSDYITGLLILSIFIFSFFVSWTLVILVFKCLGQKRVGYLSGSPFDDSTQGNRCCKPKVLRWIAFFSCLFVVAYSIALAVTNQETFVSAIDQLLDTNRVSFTTILF